MHAALAGVERREIPKRAAAVLERVGIGEYADTPISKLSKGLTQRVGIAQALIGDPKLLILDEPTSGLDPISTRKVEDSLFALKQQYSIIIVPHSIQQAARIADQAAFFLMGELIEHGPTEQIFTAPRDRRTEAYITGRFG